MELLLECVEEKHGVALSDFYEFLGTLQPAEQIAQGVELKWRMLLQVFFDTEIPGEYVPLKDILQVRPPEGWLTGRAGQERWEVVHRAGVRVGTPTHVRHLPSGL